MMTLEIFTMDSLDGLSSARRPSYLQAELCRLGWEQASGPIGKAILMIHETSGQFKLDAIYGGKNDEQ